jgi:hypothetical protein
MDLTTITTAMNSYGLIGAIVIMLVIRTLDNRALTKQISHSDITNANIVEAISSAAEDMTDSVTDSTTKMMDVLHKHTEVEEDRYDMISKRLDTMEGRQIKNTSLIQEMKQFKQAIDNNTQAMNGLKEALVQQQIFFTKWEVIVEQQNKTLEQIHNKVS